MPDELRAFAEAPDRYTRLADDVERVADDELCVVQGATWAGVVDVHVAADGVAELVRRAHALVPPAKELTWWIGPSVDPPDLYERLLALGLRPAADGPVVHSLACAAPPPPGPADVEVRLVADFAEYATAHELMWAAHGARPERAGQERARLRASFESARRAGSPATFVAYLDGAAVGVGRSVYSDRGSFLIAGGVLPEARNRGVYRALVRARWDDAAARGLPGLVTEALPDTSYPILIRLGFVEVCRIRRLKDAR